MEAVERKLAAIMFTDIYGYSRMMSRDENKAIQLLSIHDTILEDSIKKHKGQIIKKIGDSILAVFNSSIEALSCAVELQAAFKDYCEGKGEDEKIIIRIGIHVGDVIVKDNDIFGEGVNVASRLEQLADPGGVCLSNAVYDSAKSSNHFNIVKQGEVQLKNINEKYTVYKVPSVFGEQYRKKVTGPVNSGQEYSYRIKQINDLPVKFLSPLEVAGYSLVLFLVLFYGGFLINSFIPDTSGRVLADPRSWLIFLGSMILFVAVCVYFISAKSVRVIFSDLCDSDKILEFLISQIGYRRSVKVNNQVVFKPTVFQFVMYSARKIKVLIDGNSVVISGNYMMIRKLIKTMKAMEG